MGDVVSYSVNFVNYQLKCANPERLLRDLAFFKHKYVMRLLNDLLSAKKTGIIKTIMSWILRYSSYMHKNFFKRRQLQEFFLQELTRWALLSSQATNNIIMFGWKLNSVFQISFPKQYFNQTLSKTALTSKQKFQVAQTCTENITPGQGQLLLPSSK